MGNKSQEIPKIIWFLWFQGIEKAPEIVKKTFGSWKNHNPGWQIVFIDKNNLFKYIEVQKLIGRNYEVASKQALSDIIRINLLNKYGGVWVDATCFCCKPLDNWLDSYMNTGFFAFQKPGIDRPISSWFLASSLHSQITSKYCKEVNLYWSKTYFSNQNTRIGKFINKHLQDLIHRCKYESKMFWFLFLVMRVFKVYPYFWFHYIFALLIKKNEIFKKKWEQTKKFSADIPHKLQHFGLVNSITKEIKLIIDERNDPCYKLKWKFNKNEYCENSIVNYLLNNK